MILNAQSHYYGLVGLVADCHDTFVPRECILAFERDTRGAEDILSLGCRSFAPWQPLKGFSLRLKGKTLAQDGGLEVALEPKI
jgi:hypothetical protein